MLRRELRSPSDQVQLSGTSGHTAGHPPPPTLFIFPAQMPPRSLLCCACSWTWFLPRVTGTLPGSPFHPG